MQWYWTLYPRLRRLLPVETILEVGPGYGRWTAYLKEFCEEMVLVDISEKCIHHCRSRFGEEQMTYRVGSGDTLDGVEDSSVDLIFSWETLVYLEAPELQSYLKEFARVLRPGGKGFLHHSNLGAYLGYFDRTLKIPKRIRDLLKKRRLLDYDQWRARTVTAELVARWVTECGLYVEAQELIPWGGRRLIDGLTTVSTEPPERDREVLENPGFHDRAYEIQRLSWLYGEGVPW